MGHKGLLLIVQELDKQWRQAEEAWDMHLNLGAIYCGGPQQAMFQATPVYV